MKCDEARERMVSSPAGAPPADAAEHLRGCEACRVFARRDETVRRLLALKRHEQPDDHFETRLLARVREEIAGTVPGRRWLPGWLADRWTPSYGYAAAAAAALILVAVRWLPPAAGPGAAGAPVIADQPPAPAAPAPALRGPEPARAPVEYVSSVPVAPTNPGTGGIRYGPGPSVPVRYDY